MDENNVNLQDELLSLTRQFLQESGSSERAVRLIRMEAKLERDLGIGSIEKAELFHRVEDHFHIKLPSELLATASTLEDIYNALSKAPEQEKFKYLKKIETKYEGVDIDPSQAKTLMDVLFLYAEKDPKRPYVYLQQESSEIVITYGELLDKSLRVASGLSALGVIEGDTIALMLPTSTDFFCGFHGSLLAGAIPVPIYPPIRMDQIEEYAHKEARILYNAGVKILISFKQAYQLNRLLKPFVPSLTHITDIDALLKHEKLSKLPAYDEEDIALLQYTSGSTGDPKGVVLLHKNLMANIHAYGEGINLQPGDVAVSWLPLYHDMGLIGSVLGTLYYGMPLMLMSPLDFLSRPEKWLWTMHYRRGTLSAAPNFAYELCVKKIKEKDIEGLDLSCWRLAFNGAEAIYPKTLERFYKKFSRYGLKKTALFPVFGLAENSVALTFPPLGREPWIDYIDQEKFETEQKAAIPNKQTKNMYAFVSCGSAIPHHEVRVVDNNDKKLGDRVVGSLQFRGPSAMQGYFRKPGATKAVYHKGWWDTGDLAYMVEGEIFVTGRKKDLIIKGGRNYYPPEIEEAAEVDGVRKGCIAAFGVYEEKTGTEKLVIVAEKSARIEADEDKIIADINASVTRRIMIPPDEIVLTQPKTIPKTSSGKLRRSSCKLLYMQGTLQSAGKPLWLQLTRLFFIGIGKKLKKLGINSLKFLYSFYVVLMVLTTFVPMRLILFFLKEKSASIVVKQWSKLIIRLAFCSLKVKGGKNIRLYSPQIYVANHASYADAVLLLSVLPTKTKFVAKVELRKYPIVGRLLKRLGHIFVDRVDVTKNKSDLKKIAVKINEGCSILFFPEGTFTRVAGVRPFKMGPFQIADKYQIPICPIAIQNSRKILRANRFLFAPTWAKLIVSKPRFPAGNEWQDIVQLRDWSRKVISENCLEEPIDLIAAGPES